MHNTLEEFFTKEDNKKMIRQILEFPLLISRGILDSVQYVERYESEDIADDLRKKDRIAVAWFGMGASALIGEYIANYLQNSPTTNRCVIVDVYRSVPSPTLCRRAYDIYIFYSYSGNTLETLKALDIITKQCEGVSKNSLMLVFSVGGKIEKMARKKMVPHIKLVEGFASRSHFPYGLALAFSLISQIIGLKQSLEDLRNTELSKYVESLSDEDMCRNISDLADRIKGRTAIIIAESILTPVAKRFIAQFNENAKHFAVYFELPEGAHNFIVGLREIDRRNIFNIVLRRESEDSFMRRYIDIVKEKISHLDFYEFLITDGGRFSWRTLLIPTIFADILSVFLAEIKGLSAFDIKEITAIKSEL